VRQFQPIARAAVVAAPPALVTEPCSFSFLVVEPEPVFSPAQRAGVVFPIKKKGVYSQRNQNVFPLALCLLLYFVFV
jgi:hypothetical protein